VRLQGDYRFLGAAWNAAMGHARMQKYKLDKRRPALEVYTNQPGAVTSSNDLLTELLVPIA
jgi:DNA gyrase inhibitor GyrI